MTITRRDREDFILTTVDEATREHRAIEIASGLVAACLSDSHLALPERLQDQFPWMEFLSQGERVEFTHEIVRVMRACAAVCHFRQLLISFNAWKSTAQAHAHGFTSDDQLEWIDTPVPAPRPTLE